MWYNFLKYHKCSLRFKTGRLSTKLRSLTCCGLQKQQGEETADRDSTLHDGCQENCDGLTDYIYQGRKVKVHAKGRGGAKRGPTGGGPEIHVFEEDHKESLCTRTCLVFLLSSNTLITPKSLNLQTFYCIFSD